MNEPQVSIVIVSYGTRDLTLAAIASACRVGKRIPLEVVVVDNASPDDSAEAVATGYPQVRLIRSPVNRGFGGGANLGARAARGRWLLFLNSDAELLDQSLPPLLAAAAAVPAPGAIGPRIEGPDGPEPSIGHFYTMRRDVAHFLRLDRLFPRSRSMEGIFIRRLPAETSRVEWVTGACLLVDRKVFLELGGFDEAYFMYVEDMDLCYRLHHAGRTNLYVPAAVIRHRRAASPRSSGFLIDGGHSPEYFVRKFDIRYPWVFQRSRRILGLAARLAVLGARVAGGKLRGKDVAVPAREAAICRRSLASLLGRRRTGEAGKRRPA